MAYVPSVTFRESPLGPWGTSKNSGAQILPGAIPPAQTRPTEAIGSISKVNAYLSKSGLPRRNTLPPLILDNSKHLIEYKEIKQIEPGDENMSSRRVGKYTRKRTRRESNREADEKNTIEEGKCADTQLVEMAAYPGYSPDKPTPLPHNLDTLEQMKRVTRAHAKLSTKARKFRDAWCQLFYFQYSQEIFLDYYWWFFLHRYQPGHHVPIQDLLFTRISENYVKLLCQPIELKWRDTHFKMYPDAIAQCVYSTFVCAYPNSWNNFDDAFKNELSLCITLWQVGTRPLPGLWTKWNLALLEPQNLLKHVGREKETASDKKSPQRLPVIDSVQESERDDMEMDKEVSSEFRRLSMDEVKKTLDGSTETLVPLVRHKQRKKEEGGELVPSVSEEKRIGLARKQFQALEERSKIQKDLSPDSLMESPSLCKLEVALQSQESNDCDPEWEQPPTQAKGAMPSKNQNDLKQRVQPQPNVGIKPKPTGLSPQGVGKDSRKRAQVLPKVGNKSNGQPSPRLKTKLTVQPTCKPGSGSKLSSRTGSASKNTSHPYTRPESASKKAVQKSPRRSLQPTSNVGQSSLSRLTSPATKETTQSKNTRSNLQPGKMSQQQPASKVKQGKATLSPADELINRAKAKIDGLQNARLTQTTSTTRPTPTQRTASSNTHNLNQAKYGRQVSDKRTQEGPATIKHQGTDSAAVSKNIPQRPVLQAKRRLMQTKKNVPTDTLAKNRISTASQTTSMRRDPNSQACSDLLPNSGQSATSQAPNHNISQSTKVEASTQVGGSEPAAPSKNAPQTKNKQARTSFTTTATKPSPQKLKDSETQHTETPSSPITSKSMYQQACAELKEMSLAFKERTTEEILSSIKGPEFEHVLFNFHGHSPLVKHYISNTRRTHMNEKESIVGRTELIEDQPERAVCYKEILEESKKSSEKNHAMFQRYYELQKQVIAASNKKRLDELHKHEENVKQVLANKREVQQLSNELMLCAAQRKDMDRSERSNAIQKVLDRVID